MATSAMRSVVRVFWAAAMGLMAVCAYAHQEASVIREFGGKGTQKGQFSETTAFYADNAGNLYVSDATYRRIQKFDTAGEVALEIGGLASHQKPMALTTDGAGYIYVVDLDFVPLEGIKDRPVLYYCHCVRKYTPSGELAATFYYLPVKEKRPWAESATLAVNEEGKVSAFIQFGNLERKVLIAVKPMNGHILVLDDDTIYELDASGETVNVFGMKGGRDGETHEAASMTADAQGNVYVADAKNDRVVVFDDKGEFVRAFGMLGSQDGEFRSPAQIAAMENGSILVGDEATYFRVQGSKLPQRKDDPSPLIPQEQLPLYQRVATTRQHVTLMTRVQEFDGNGAYKDKTLLRFPVESYDSWHYRLRAIGGDGRLYYQHKDTLAVRVYLPDRAIQWGNINKTLNLRYEVSTLLQEVDNPDLDEQLGIRADFRAKGFLFQKNVLSFLIPSGAVGGSGEANLELAYDWNQRERVGLSGGYYGLRAKSASYYQTEAGLDPERSFPQDDTDKTTYDQGLFQITWERTLNDDPYRYRTMMGFVNLGFGRSVSVNDAISSRNLRVFTTDSKFLDWEVGVEYDLSPRWYAMASVLRGPAFGGYDAWWTYIDETGALFARGFNNGRETRAQFAVDGYF